MLYGNVCLPVSFVNFLDLVQDHTLPRLPVFSDRWTPAYPENCFPVIPLIIHGDLILLCQVYRWGRKFGVEPPKSW